MPESKCRRVALVTPLRDELENLPKLIKSIESQTVPIYLWVIVQNGSTDGSVEFLKSLDSVTNVENFVVLHYDDLGNEYALGSKYSTVVSRGFKYIKRSLEESRIRRLQYIGICDADCFPPVNYYEELTNFMLDNSISISSGIGLFMNGKKDGEAKDWVRGNCRLWSYDCFIESGYLKGPSADALSLAKARIKGFVCRPKADLFYSCREMGKKAKYEYYGYANYYRGITFIYCLLKVVNYFRIGQLNNGLLFLKGYTYSYINNKDKIDDKEIIEYFTGMLNRKIHIKYIEMKRWFESVFSL